ncbi:MAG: nucleotidyltransferase family protein [Acholeplasmatales bacterium]|nr:nucleotidyltransferase family protein [Acholeplasmatales bacterium]
MDIIKLLKSYVNKEQLNIEINNSDIKLLIEQSLQTLLYPVTNNKEYKRYYISWVVKQEEFYNIQSEISNIFNDNNISHVFFKGSVLSKIYDDSSVRTRGDIDLYVSSNDMNRAKEVLVSNGYVVDSDVVDCMHHYAYKKNGIEVELHFNMFDPDCDKSWIKLFNNPFELCDLVSGSLYEFKATYHLIYCIMHFAHHLRHGAGIRYMLDFYYMFKKTNIDFNLLHNILNECKLDRLYSNIINVLRYVFDVDFDSSIGDIDIKYFIDYMLEYGIHGHANNETSVQASVHSNKFRYFISRVFLLNKPYRIARYPKLGKWYFYIICLIVHWCYLITHKIGSMFKFLFGKNKNKELYKKLGV